MNPHYRPSLADIHAYAVQPSAGKIKLDAMENPFSMPASCLEAVAQAVADCPMNRYPNPNQQPFKQLLINQGLASSRHEIILGNGSDELIQCLHQALTPQSSVMTLDPAFSMVELNATLLGLKVVKIPLGEDFSLPTDALLAQIARIRPALLWLAYPNNPTGNTFNRDGMRAVIHAMARHEGLVVLDEAYSPFTGGDTLLEWMDEFPEVMVMRTLSKLGLAGLRLGYLMGHSALLSPLEKIRLPFNTNRLSIVAASVILQDYHAVLNEQAAQIAQERDQMMAFFQAYSSLRPNLRLRVFPSKANFLLVRCDHSATLFQWLLGSNILIKDMSKASALLRDCLRFTIGSPSENVAVRSALNAFPMMISPVA
jgi:histidinol-phosphate aminotransferase